MPDIDGVELLKRIKKINPEIQVIIMTGHINLEIESKVMRNGAFKCLLKPFTDITLIIYDPK